MPIISVKPTSNLTEAQGPGKSGSSTGHLAKQAVSAARAAGIEIPKNAQGIAASQISKGADPASVFAVQVVVDVPDPIVEEPEVPAEPVVTADLEPEIAVQDDTATNATIAFTATPQEIALELLA